jgi:phage-related protein
METFAWPTQAGAAAQTSFKKGRNDFGDGYTQHYTIGINPIIKVWSISVLEDESAEEIIDFLERHKGIYPFLWTPPNKVQPIQVICENFTDENLGYTAKRVSATFERYQGV